MFIALLFVVLLILGLLIYSSFSWGYVLFNYWYWFILPAFPMLPIITFYQAVGLMFFIGLFNIRNSTLLTSLQSKKDKNTEVVGAFLAPWLSLLIGWTIKVLFF